MKLLKKTKNAFKFIYPIAVAFMLTIGAGYAAESGDLILFYIWLVWAIIVALLIPTTIICRKLDERFDRLEEILAKKENEEEQVTRN